jgi:hypothetical protein
MSSKLKRADVVVRSGEVTRLEDAAGTRLQVLHGSVWITQDGDLNDYYLPAARTMTLDRPGVVLVYALEPAELIIWQPVPRISVAAQVARGLARVSRLLAP